MPKEVTLTGIVYVPGGVLEPPPLPPEPPPPVPPPELVQLETPLAKIAARIASRKSLRRFKRASDTRSSPQASGRARGKAGPPELGVSASGVAKAGLPEFCRSSRTV